MKKIRVLTNVGVKFSIVEHSGVIRVSTSLESSNYVLNFIKSNKINYYSIQHKSQRPEKFAIKGLPSDYPMNKIFQSLTSQEFLFYKSVSSGLINKT